MGGALLLPDFFTICLAISGAILLRILIQALPEKLESILDMSIILAYIAGMLVHFIIYQGIDIFLLTIAYVTYYHFGILFDRGKFEKRKHLIELVRESDVVEIEQTKTYSRLCVDILLTAFVMAGGIAFFIFAPETYSLMKFLIMLAFIYVLVKTVERISNFLSTKMYWLKDADKLIVLSFFQSREYPLSDLKAVETESSPDILKLHPLFTFLSSNLDFTCSNQAVLKLSFPGEYVYLTPNQIDQWVSILKKFVPESLEQPEKKVLPIWHPTVLKRLFWKGYFAITVKGISAYTSLILILILLDVPSWVIVTVSIFWWLLNLYISDRVLIAATDAKRVTEGELYERAQAIFHRANVKNPQLFIADSPVYNGFATGMNIGRSTIVLTKATMELSDEAVDAILAHEAMHVKHRDVLIVQLARIVFMGILALIIYQFYDQLLVLAERKSFLIVVFVYLIMILFPLFLSFVSQWTEVRADHLGAKLLPNGNEQMALGLRELALRSEKDIEKSLAYQRINDENEENRVSESERQHWFIRLIEFQFQAHPPMYWRIQSLENSKTWKEAKKQWLIERITESLPNFK